jgi:death-on-curing protein
MSPEFLDVADILAIHALQVERFDGSAGVRDPGLLDSAAAQPRATFGGAFLHADLLAMAAAYRIHLVRNHPFVDGNKRTGLAAALTFLDLDGHPIDRPSATLEAMTISVVEGRIDKDEVARRLRDLSEGEGLA